KLTAEGLKRRWALLYVAPVGLFLAGIAVGVTLGGGSRTPGVGFSAFLIGFIVLFYLAIPLATLHWYAKYFRHAAEATSLGDLEFGFDATTLQWLRLFLGNLALAIVTLGFGITYWGYRNWAF